MTDDRPTLAGDLEPGDLVTEAMDSGARQDVYLVQTTVHDGRWLVQLSNGYQRLEHPGSVLVRRRARVLLTPEHVAQDRLYLELHGARERLCRAQLAVASSHDRDDLSDAVALIDRVGSQLPQWSRHDQARHLFGRNVDGSTLDGAR